MARSGSATTQVQALVGGQAPGESDREHTRIERPLGRLGVGEPFAPSEPVGGCDCSDEFDHGGSRRRPGLPERLVGDGVDGVPGRGICGSGHPAAPRYSSRRSRIGVHSHVGTWTPFVTWVIGTSSTSRP